MYTTQDTMPKETADRPAATDTPGRGRSLTTAVRAGIGRVLPSEPLVRNGHLLAISSLVNAGVGAIFWLFATHWYDDEVVGVSYSALSASLLLANIGQLNLNDFLIRFLPCSGRQTRRLLLTCYAVTASWSAVVCLVFVLLVPAISPELAFLRDPLVAIWFVAATAAYTIFVLQDGALTAMRRPGWVVAENMVFAFVKIALLAGGALLVLKTGILLSWAGGLLISLLVANYLLLRRAVPRHERENPDAVRPPRLLSYAAADYTGSLFRMAAYTLVPLMVLSSLGAEQSAYFSLAWIIGYVLFLVVRNMGSSLVVEAVRRPERLAEHGLRVLRHSGMMLAAGVAVIVAGAPWILKLFGPGYAENGTTLLRLLALSALPNLVFSVAVDVLRARRRMRLVVGLQIALCVLVLGMVQLLLPVFGVTGAGIAWLAAECLIAAPLLIWRSRWLDPAAGMHVTTSGSTS
ncbi:lipopolysaccharide biosynthesis protein [Streptomyces luteogriseus]|uniref:lipopolysaccharide biosynthesis protein n=1 Tax=Streptomyces luteogriseus TaxID=68233 RepID=UPI00340DE0D6